MQQKLSDLPHMLLLVPERLLRWEEGRRPTRVVALPREEE